MGTKEVDLIADAIAGTEKEIFDAGFDREPAEETDHDGDKSPEEMGDGLEGQHEVEAEAEEETEGEQPEGESEEAETEGDQPRDPKTGQFTKKDTEETDEHSGEQQPQQRTRTDDHRVPRTALLSERDRRQAAEAAAEAAKTELATFRQQSQEQFAALNSRLDALLMARPVQPQQQQTETKPEQKPDLFENPDGYINHATKPLMDRIDALARSNFETRAEMSMRLAAVNHKEVFPAAWESFQKLSPNDPDQAAAARRIANAPDPGEALVNWHRQQVTLREVGTDPAAYKAKIAAEAREALMNDPEFKKQLLESMRGEATGQPNSQPRTKTRLPPSANSARGGSSATQTDPRTFDNSEQAVFESAWE